MNAQAEMAVHRAKLEAAAQVPALKRAKADYALSRPVMPPMDSQFSRSARMLGWALIYCAAFVLGGVIAMFWNLYS